MFTHSIRGDKMVCLCRLLKHDQLGRHQCTHKRFCLSFSSFILFSICRYCILNEVWRLVSDGILNVKDIDSVMSDGLGMRYAFLGALETAHLNAEGMANYCERYQKSIYDVRSLETDSLWMKLTCLLSQGERNNGTNTTHARTRCRKHFQAIGRNVPIGQIGWASCVAWSMPHQVEPIEEKFVRWLLKTSNHREGRVSHRNARGMRWSRSSDTKQPDFDGRHQTMILSQSLTTARFFGLLSLCGRASPHLWFYCRCSPMSQR